MDEQLQHMIELFNSPVKNISKEQGVTMVEFENGKCVPLYGETITLNHQIPTCSFCGNPAVGGEPLYSPDDESFICKDCAILAVETFANNGFEVNLKVKGYNKIAKQLEEMGEQATNKK